MIAIKETRAGGGIRERVRAQAYLRVSTEEQADSGLGLEAQRAAIRNAAERLGLEVVQWHADEGVSGKSIDGRFGLLDAIEAVKRGSVLIVARRDRLARDSMLACWIEKEVAKRQGRIVSVAGEGTDNDDPTSVLMRRIVDAFSEYERLLIGARTKAALRVKARRGERVGRHAAFGYRLDGSGQQVEDTHEQDGIRLMLDMRNRGASLDEISKAMERKGYLGRKGGRLSTGTIFKVIRREATR